MIRVGQKFHEERVRRGLTIEDVARATKIRPSFITAIEKGEYHKIPSASYAKGFVRNYAEYLGLPTKEILALFRREFDVEKNLKVLPDPYTRQKMIPVKRTKFQFTLFFLAALLVLLCGFLLYQYRSAFFSPSLTIDAPKTEIVTSTEVVVSGKSEPSATVTVNNTPVALDSDGNFKKTVTVFPGESVITIRAKNRLGKESVIERKVVLKE